MDNGLANFKAQLQAKLGSEQCRPFVCEGNPLECNAMLVGLNPVTNTGNFWDYWDDAGFSRSKWEVAYDKCRGGKSSPSRTRSRLDRIRKVLVEANFKVLEADICPWFAKNWRDLKSKYGPFKRGMLPFDWFHSGLLQVVKPRAVFVHGKRPVAQLGEWFGVDLSVDTKGEHPYQIRTVKLKWGPVAVCSSVHLAYPFQGWDNEKVGDCASELAKEAGSDRVTR